MKKILCVFWAMLAWAGTIASIISRRHTMKRFTLAIALLALFAVPALADFAGTGFSSPPLPSQTGNSGKYLTTNGSKASWGTVSASGDDLGDATADNVAALFSGSGDYLKSDGTRGTPTGSGTVNGPATATEDNIVTWGADNATLKDSGHKLSEYAPLVSPVFTTPNIGSATGSVSGNAGTATALAADPANCAAGQIALGVTAAGVAECTATPSVTTLTGAVTGNASTASALAADPADCPAGQVATGIAASGALSCTATPSVTTLTGAVTGNASTASALAADPADCPAGQIATGIAASGALSCTATPTVTTMTAGSFVSTAADGERQMGAVNTNDNTVALPEGYFYYDNTADTFEANVGGTMRRLITSADYKYYKINIPDAATTDNVIIDGPIPLAQAWDNVLIVVQDNTGKLSGSAADNVTVNMSYCSSISTPTCTNVFTTDQTATGAAILTPALNNTAPSAGDYIRVTISAANMTNKKVYIRARYRE